MPDNMDANCRLPLKTTQTITTRTGLNLVINTVAETEEVAVSLQISTTKPCLLHWGVRHQGQQEWGVPDPSVWPVDTRTFGPNAVQTPFVPQQGTSALTVRCQTGFAYASLDFVLFFPEDKRWDNNGGRNYQVSLLRPAPSTQDLSAILRALAAPGEVAFERTFDLDKLGRLAVAASKTEGRHRLVLVGETPGAVLLHWGMARRSPHEWLLPSTSVASSAPTVFLEKAAQTPFTRKDGLNQLWLEFAPEDLPLGIQFVLRQEVGAGRWINFRGGNFYVPVQGSPIKLSSLGDETVAQLAEEVIRAETTHNSWTLMHRFHLCHDLLDRARGSVEALALCFVWLRFSAIRQLTWQRNYNTKPRELAHAQDRLTQKLAQSYRAEPAARPILRLMLTTVGRGGEGQRIRDEILAIMHRHHIKEVSGHFLEEWHQKLHNNTTPDDVVICEAYLEFLRSHGRQDRFDEVLRAGGVTRERLQSFERPIRTSPDFVPHLKDALIHDFQHFLAILKAAHSGTDFSTALNAARGQLDGGIHGLLDWIMAHRNESVEGLVHLVRQITEARRQISSRLVQSEGLRELLYLDLALEQVLRAAVERNIHLGMSGEQLADLIARVLENVTLSYEDPELAACSRHWERLQTMPRMGSEWSLHAKSVTDRISRGLSAWIDRFYQLLQPKAEHLGHGFQAELWTISLFSEEVVRGSSLGFVLSMLLHHIDPLLRKAAGLGGWQIISRGEGTGRVEVVESLRSIQQSRFEVPVVIVTDKVSGDEEIPENVAAVIAPDVTDIVSHVAVRARNAGVLFASCHDAEALQRLKAHRGKLVRVEVSAGGDVLVQEAVIEPSPGASRPRAPKLALQPRKFSKYAVAMAEFNEEIVGGKSCHLARLRGALPDWIHLPPGAALPFGVFEQVLRLPLNKPVADRYASLASRVADGTPESLADLRDCVMSLQAPDELRTTLQTAMIRAGLAWPEDWAQVWTRIKQVWASKWNDRAVLSRLKMALPHDDLFMAVLIQQVVPADYAFVVHTVNPATGNPNELFAEVVLGLGETLVGNHPGRALSFVADKNSSALKLLSYPGKSLGLRGGGLIFRSDSNGEDLAGYAGAGLYDSVLLQEPCAFCTDYAQERLIWDEGFRREVLGTIARIGVEIERVAGSPQDIEGAVAQGRYYVVQTRAQVGLG